MTGRDLWFVVPAGYDDPARVSGGNVYDQRVRDELGASGWRVRVVETDPDAAAGPFARIPDGALVLVDGLVALRSADATATAAGRLRIAALVHMAAGAFDDAGPDVLAAERTALASVQSVIATSRWLRGDLVGRGLCAAERAVVATPGADAAPLATGTERGGSLLSVGVVAPHKGQDTLVDALTRIAAHDGWHCTLAGSTTADPAFTAELAERAARGGVSGRLRWPGVLTARELDVAYAGTDLLVAPSRTESYGIAVGDALRRGIPVVASRAGGLPEAAVPADAAVLVAPGDVDALAEALRRWVSDPALRARLTGAARRAATHRADWSDTASAIDAALRELT